ncbi:MAG: tetratricopeptide repeat protein [Gammaproteobacteria bacterium]|nr:tetratricopeptide repeat protein [Gammaproteobacteria bacterium]
MPARFVGRKGELKKLLAQLHVTHRNKVIGVTGMGGIGKTSLAIKVAHLVKDRFEDGILWGRLGQDGSAPAAIAQSFAAAFGQAQAVISAPDEATKGAELRRILANKQVLVIFDDVEDSAQLRHLLPNGERNLTLITSRNRKLLSNLGAKITAMKPFGEKDSLDLLKLWIDSRRVQAELNQAKRIAGLVDGLPLALDVVGGYLKESADLTLTEYAELLENEASRLVEISDWEDTSKSVEASFSLSLRRLKPTIQQLFAALSIFPGPHFSSEAVAVVVDKNFARVKQELGQLHSLSLIQRRDELSDVHPTLDSVRYQLHALLKLYARSFLSESDADTYAHRAVTYFANLVAENWQRENYPLLDLDWGNIYGILLWTVGHQRATEVVAGVNRLTQTDSGVIGFMDVRGYWTEARSLLKEATKAAQQMAKQDLILAALFARWGALAGRQGDKKEANQYFTQSRQYLSDPPRSSEEALVKTELLAFQTITEPDNESKHATIEEALNLLENVQQKVSDERFKAQVGYLKIMQGGIVGETADLKQAIKLTEDGLALLPDEPTPVRFNGYINLSNFNYWLGRIDQCDVHTDDAIAVAEKWNDRPLLANLYALKGSNLLQQGRYRAALTAYRQALTYCQDIGYLPEQATSYSSMGLCYHRLGESDRALAELQRGLELAQQHILTAAEAILRLNFARYYLDAHDPAQAQPYAKQAHAICLAEELVYEIPEALSLQAEVALQQGRPEAALPLAEKSLATANHTDFQQAQGVSLRVLGLVKTSLGQLDNALAKCRESLDTLAQQDPYERGQSHLALARCHLARQEPQPALQNAHAALAMFEKLKATRDQKAAQQVIDTLHRRYTLG